MHRKISFFRIHTVAFITGASLLLSPWIEAQVTTPVLPSQEQVQWADAEIGVIIHLDINVFAPETFDYARFETLPPLTLFNPPELNTDQWLASAKNAGARYAVLVAKHGTGFCLWPTRSHGYHVGKTPWQNGTGDVVRDFIASCRRYGIRPGLYYNTNLNTYLGAGPAGTSRSGKREAYNKTVIDQLRELWTEYGSLSEIWFDGGVIADSCGGIAEEVRQMIREYQPGAMLFQGPPECGNLIRWVGNEDGRAPYPHWSRANVMASSSGAFAIADAHGDPEGKIWAPAEADFPGRRQSSWNGGWLWRAGEESSVFTASELADRYYSSVGRNANMLIGMTIDTAGRFPLPDSIAFAGFGARVRQIFGHPLARMSGSGTELILPLGERPVSVNHIVLCEEISLGERIRAFEVQALDRGVWRRVCAGTSVGHKFIGKFDEVKAPSLRLRITESSGEPRLKEFSAHYAH
jgi:alpha-L-fucosidase